MPIFGKGRKKGRIVLGKARDRRERTEFLGKEIFRDSSGNRLYRKAYAWSWAHSSKKAIERSFPLLFLPVYGKPFIEQRSEQKKKPVVVLDWGCGTGKAISEFANKYKKKIVAYGFSKDSYKEWKKIRSAKFIHATAEDLFRYLKNNSVDLIYSRLGLFCLFFSGPAGKGSMNHGAEYVRKLLQKVSPGGKIVFDIPEHRNKETKEALKASVGDAAGIVLSEDTVYITKK